MTRFNYFDFFAPIYDRYIKPTDPNKIKMLAGLPINGYLLDAGGGTGRISNLLKDLVNGVVIADSSMGMLSQALKKDSLLPVCSNSERLPFKDGIFERIIMVDALHHVADYEETIGELWRVVKPGGRIIIEEPNIKRWEVKALAITEKITFMRSHFVHSSRIRDAFSYPSASIRIESEGLTTWIVVDKQSS